MAESTNTLLEQILVDLNHVGDLLSAIDHAQGDDIAHWQEISVINHRVRRLVNQLDQDGLTQLPALAVFAFSDAQIISCWGNCADEIETLLSPGNS